jgi:hypothetical protein
MKRILKHLAPEGAVYDYGKYAGAGFESTSPEDFKCMTDDEIDLYFEQLGVEMRPSADLIIKLRAQFEKMPMCAEKLKLEKNIKNLERDFTDAFLRFDAFEQFGWPDGLIVRFVPPSSVTLKDGTKKLRGPQRTAFPQSPSAQEGTPMLQLVRGVRPVFTRSEP